MLNDFKDEDFDSKIKNEDISVIQFSAAWCGPCSPRRDVPRWKGFLAGVLTAGADPDHFTVFNIKAFDQSAFAHLATVCLQLRHHLLDQSIRPSLEREDPLVHEVRKNNTVGDGGIVQVRTVCIRNRLHQ